MFVSNDSGLQKKVWLIWYNELNYKAFKVKKSLHIQHEFISLKLIAFAKLNKSKKYKFSPSAEELKKYKFSGQKMTAVLDLVPKINLLHNK